MSFFISAVSFALFLSTLIASGKIALFMPRVFPIIVRVVFSGIFPASVLLQTSLFSPAGEKLSKLVSRSRLFKKTGLCESLAPAVIAGQICGFPMGAILISKTNAPRQKKELALALGSVPSLAFFMTFSKNGFLLWLMCVITLFIFALAFPSCKEHSSPLSYPTESFAKILSSSVSSAVQVSGTIIFFASVTALIPDTLPSLIKEFLISLLEIGCAASFCKTPLILAFALSFSGLSIIAQLYYLSGGASLKKYLLSRLFILPVLYTGIEFEKISLFIILFLLFVLMFFISAKKPLQNLHV